MQLEAYPGAVDSLLWPRTHAAPLTNCACSCARGDVEHLCKARMGPARPHALLLLRADLVHVAMSSYSIPLPVSLPHPSFCLSLSLSRSLPRCFPESLRQNNLFSPSPNYPKLMLLVANLHMPDMTWFWLKAHAGQSGLRHHLRASCDCRVVYQCRRIYSLELERVFSWMDRQTDR